MNLKSYPKPSGLFAKAGIKYSGRSVTPDKGYGDARRGKPLALSKSTNETQGGLTERTSSLKCLKQQYKF